MDISSVKELCTVGVGLAGIVASTVVSVYSIRHSDITRTQKARIQEMLAALKGFHELEEIYIKKLSEARIKNGETTFVKHDSILKETRRELRERGIEFDFSPSDLAFYRNSLGVQAS